MPKKNLVIKDAKHVYVFLKYKMKNNNTFNLVKPIVVLMKFYLNVLSNFFFLLLKIYAFFFLSVLHACLRIKIF